MFERSAIAFVAGLQDDIAVREIKAVRKQLSDWPEEAFATRTLPENLGPGNILLVEAGFEHVTEIVSGFGKIGVPAEQVGRKAGARMAGYLESDAFAGPYLTDQFLLPFALAGGGSFTSVKPSRHALTANEQIQRLLGRSFKVEKTTGAFQWTYG